MPSQQLSALEQIPCELCGSSAQSIECFTSGHPPTEIGQWRLVRCDDCGLIFLNPRPTSAQIAAYYPSRYYQASEALMQQNGKPGMARALKTRTKRWLASQHYRSINDESPGNWAKRRLLSLWRRRWEALPPLQQPGRLLDIGCGTGSYMEFMRDAGWHVVGTEIGDVAAEICRQKGLDVRQGPVEELDLPSGGFDVVHLGQVLEHTHRPRAVLEAANRVLRPGGLLMLDVPNYDAPLRRLFGPQWFAVEAPRHLYHFTPLTLRRLVEACGFAVDKLYTKAIAAGAERHLVVTAAFAGRGIQNNDDVSPGIELTRHLNQLSERMGCGDTIYVEARQRSRSE